MSIKKKVNMLVVDSCAFIRGCNLHEMGEEIYTLEEVFDEIRDRETKQRLKCLPFQLKFREPPTEDIKWVSEFAKKTGDFSSLSMVDIKLIALVYFLDKQAHQGSDAHLNKVPNQKIVFNTSTVKFDEQFKNIPGFYYSKNDTKNQNKHQKGNYDQGRMSGN
jgi:LOC398701 protein